MPRQLIPAGPSFPVVHLPKHLKPGTDIILFEGKGDLGSITGLQKLKVKLIWEVSAGRGTIVRAAERTPSSAFVMKWNNTLSLPPFPSTTLYMPRLQPPVYGIGGEFVSPPGSVERIEFYLVNALEFIRKLNLRAGNMHAIVQSLPDKISREKYVSQGGRAAVTHIGCLKRDDGSIFTSDDPDVESMLDALTWTISFASGKLIVPSALCGFDVAGSRVFFDATVPDSSPAGDVHHWCTGWFGANVEEIFPAIHRALQNPTFAEELRMMIHLYSDAHSPVITISVRLIIMQAALERLCSYWETNVRNTMSPIPASAAGGGAAHRFTAMLTAMGINISLTGDTPELQRLAAAAPIGLPNPVDGPQMSVFIRNYLAHTKGTPAAQAIVDLAQYEAYTLMGYYFERALLFILGATLPCPSRLKHGASVADYEKLPWSPNTSAVIP